VPISRGGFGQKEDGSPIRPPSFVQTAAAVDGGIQVAEQSAVIGIRAPEFSLFCTNGRETERRRVSLADYQGRWLMLLFYPRDFSLV
jgi:hypothetical protein